VITHRPRALWGLVALLGLLVVSGFDGGLAFVTDPAGASLGAKLSWLEHTPVSDSPPRIVPAGRVRDW
jgi:hypothetical protein